jgi:hypothetical protein
MFAQLNPGTVPRPRGHTGTLAVRLRRVEEIETLGFGVVADMNRESRHPGQRPPPHRAAPRRTSPAAERQAGQPFSQTAGRAR